MDRMARITQFDHVGITVADLDSVTAFFVDLGLEVEGRTFLEGDFIDEVTGMPGSRSEIVVLRPPGGGTGLSFQTESKYVRPVWPAGPGDQQMMLHLDIEVDDLVNASEQAKKAGAQMAEFQPQDNVRVFLDPAGHPFCLYVD